MYENVHPNLALVLLLERTEVKCGKGLLKTALAEYYTLFFSYKKNAFLPRLNILIFLPILG